MTQPTWNRAQDVKIASGESSLAAWLLIPDGPGPHPCVVMGHGFSMTRYDGLAAYAEAFLAAGSAVLAFDYRYFGDSGGDRRQHFSTRAQRADWRAAVGFARADERIDATRIVAWGFSFGGGLVYQSHLFNNYTAPSASAYPLGRIVRIPETVELDTVLAYKVDRYNFQLNINNLTDRLNYSQSFGNRGTPAPGRTFIVSLEAAL